MSKIIFNEHQRRQIEANPYVVSVSDRSIQYTVVFCNKKVQRIATKNTECCHPIFSLFSRQCVC